MKGFVKIQATEEQIENLRRVYNTAKEYVNNYDESKFEKVRPTWFGLSSEVYIDDRDIINDITTNSPEGVTDFSWFDSTPYPVLTSSMEKVGNILELLELNSVCELDIEAAYIFNKYKGE